MKVVTNKAQKQLTTRRTPQDTKLVVRDLSSNRRFLPNQTLRLPGAKITREDTNKGILENDAPRRAMVRETV